MANKDYEAKVTYTTIENMSVKDKIRAKNFSAAKSLNDAFADTETLNLSVKSVTVLDVHNEKSKDSKDYSVCVIETQDGELYKTSSDSVIEVVIDICDELKAAGESLTENQLACYKIKSKNNTGYLLQCTLA